MRIPPARFIGNGYRQAVCKVTMWCELMCERSDVCRVGSYGVTRWLANSVSLIYFAAMALAAATGSAAFSGTYATTSLKISTSNTVRS